MNATAPNPQEPAKPPPKVPDADMENEETDGGEDGTDEDGGGASRTD